LWALGSLRGLPFAAPFAYVAAIDAASSVEGDGLKQWVCASFGGASKLWAVIELDDTSSKGCGQSVIVSGKKHFFSMFFVV